MALSSGNFATPQVCADGEITGYRFMASGNSLFFSYRVTFTPNWKERMMAPFSAHEEL